MEACGEREGAAATSQARLGGSGPQGEGGGGEGRCASRLENLSTLHPAVRPRVLQEGARVLRSSSEVRRLCTSPARVQSVGKRVQNAPPRGRKATEPLWPRPRFATFPAGPIPGGQDLLLPGSQNGLLLDFYPGCATYRQVSLLPCASVSSSVR